MPDEQRRHQWTFLVEPIAPPEPRSILSIGTECGLLRQHTAGGRPRWDREGVHLVGLIDQQEVAEPTTQEPLR